MHAGILHLDWREKANSNSIDNTHTHIQQSSLRLLRDFPGVTT